MVQKCSQCGSFDLADDPNGLVCMICAYVVEDSDRIDMTPDIIEISDGGIRSSGKLVDSGRCELYAHLDSAPGTASTSCRHSNNFRGHIKSFCSRMASNLNLSQHHIDEAMDLAARVIRDKWSPSDWLKKLVASALFVCARRDNKGVMLKDMVAVSGVDACTLMNVSSRIQKQFDIHVNPVSVDSCITRIHGRVNFTPQRKRSTKAAKTSKEHSLEQTPSVSPADIVHRAKELLAIAQLDWVNIGRHPAGVAAAVLKIAAASFGYCCDEQELREAANVSSDTISQRVGEIKESLVALGAELPWGDRVTPQNVVERYIPDILEYRPSLTLLVAVGTKSVTSVSTEDSPHSSDSFTLPPSMRPGRKRERPAVPEAPKLPTEITDDDIAQLLKSPEEIAASQELRERDAKRPLLSHREQIF